MSNIWDYFKSLFQEAEESSSSQPFLHELIERSEEEQRDYIRWKNTLVCRRLLNWLSDQYAIFRVLPQDIDEAIDFLDTPSSKGFVIHFHKTRYSRRDVTHLLDFLKEQVLQLEYKKQLSDTKTFRRDHWVETIERHYLKPRQKNGPDGTLLQGFGNIMIELQLRNEQPYNLKFSATSYHDRLFQKPEEFKGLMGRVLDIST